MSSKPKAKVSNRRGRQHEVEVTAGHGGSKKYIIAFSTESQMDTFLYDLVAMKELLQERRSQEKDFYGSVLQVGDTVTLHKPVRDIGGQGPNFVKGEYVTIIGINEGKYQVLRVADGTTGKFIFDDIDPVETEESGDQPSSQEAEL